VLVDHVIDITVNVIQRMKVPRIAKIIVV